MMAGAAILNFMLVLFDLSYISFRDFYFTHLPFITTGYDKVKGIEPYRDTDEYLQTVESFVDRFQDAQGQDATFLNDSQSQSQLKSLQTQSVDMVNENPFQLANKSGTLEKIKNRMRDRLGLNLQRGIPNILEPGIPSGKGAGE